MGMMFSERYEIKCNTELSGLVEAQSSINSKNCLTDPLKLSRLTRLSMLSSVSWSSLEMKGYGCWLGADSD